MMLLNWAEWRRVYGRFLRSGYRSLERWVLRYIHSRHTLRRLAWSISHEFNITGVNANVVSVDSIWIDGTPQAKAITTGGASVQCELADLLLILEVQDSRGKTIKYRGLLIQGKVTTIYNKLPRGASTRKERLLLEDMDRTQSLDLYRGNKPSPQSRIGSYLLGGGPGLADCACYCLMPKGYSWWNTSSPTPQPLEMGWPDSLQTPYLRAPIGVVQAIKSMAMGAMGRDIVNQHRCEWSRLVYDLLRGYRAIVMSGYNNQARVNSSGRVARFVASQPSAGKVSLYNNSIGIPPTSFGNDAHEEPEISFIKVTIRVNDASFDATTRSVFE